MDSQCSNTSDDSVLAGQDITALQAEESGGRRLFLLHGGGPETEKAHYRNTQ